MNTTTFFARIKVFFSQKKVIWSLIIVIIIVGLYFIFGRKGGASNIQTDKVKVQDIQKTVPATGQVVSSTDLSLSFQSTGVVRKINVKEGDVVRAGEVLAVLDQGVALASLKSAQGTLAQAQANYNKILAAATSQDVAVSQAAVGVASTTLSNAKQNLINQLTTAFENTRTVILSDTNSLFSNPQSDTPQYGIAGTVQTDQQLVININNGRANINNLLVSWQNEISSLNQANIDVIVADSLNNLTVISNFLNDIVTSLSSRTQITSTGSQTTVSTYQANVVAGKATVDGLYTAVTNSNQSVTSARASLSQAEATLALKQAPARSEDLDIANAQVLSAQGQVDSAQVIVNNTILRAPADGTITQIDIKLGEQAQTLKEVMMLQNVSDLHSEALVSEADIAAVVVGQTIDNTFDALGPFQHYSSKVLTVNPASTVVSGVVNYKVVGSLENIPGIKPGMTVNMTILVAEKKAVLTAPSSAIVNKDNKQFVRVIDDPKKKTYHEVPVTIGLEGDGGMTEITSGLSEGQEVVTYIK